MPVTVQLPRGGVDARDEERGVDLVEVVVRDDERGQARARRAPGRRRAAARATSGGGQLRGADTTASACCPSRRKRPAPPATITPPSVPALAMRNRRRVHSALGWRSGTAATSGAGVAPRRRRRGSASAALVPAAAKPAAEQDPAGRRGPTRPRGRHCRRRERLRRERIDAAAAAPARIPNATNTATPTQRPSGRDDPGDGRDDEPTTTTTTFRASLSVVPKSVDDEVLGARRLQADDERPDRGHQRRRASDDAGEPARTRRSRRRAGEGAGEGRAPRRWRAARGRRGRFGTRAHACTVPASARICHRASLRASERPLGRWFGAGPALDAGSRGPYSP